MTSNKRANTRIEQDPRERAVELYQAGWKTKAITQETGIERAHLYSILRARGIMPNRTRRADAQPDWTLGDAMKALQQAYVELGQAQAEVERLKAKLAEAEISED